MSKDKELISIAFKKTTRNQHGQTAYHSFDCSIMDIADDIAYGVHDLEDAIHLRLINRAHLDTPNFRQLIANNSLSRTQNHLIDSLFSQEFI